MTKGAGRILGYPGLDRGRVLYREVGRDWRHGGAAGLGGGVIESKTFSIGTLWLETFTNIKHVFIYRTKSNAS